MMKKQRKHSGFTLLELIIVMALFSVIMYSVLQLMQPVSKYFVRSSNYESTTACVDNMKRAIEGNLKYADRVRVYSDYNPYAADADPGEAREDYTPSDTLKDQVTDFYKEFFWQRKYIDCSGKIYVLVFDNTQYATVTKDSVDQMYYVEGHNTLDSYKGLNSGQMVLYEFEFTDTDDETPNFTITPHPWYVNQNLYGNYNYQFSLGDDNTYDSVEGFEIATEENHEPVIKKMTFNPKECAIQINAYEVERSKNGGGSLKVNTTSNVSFASFSMKNVLDSTKMFTESSKDYKPVLSAGASTEYDSLSAIEVARYKPMEANSAHDFTAQSYAGDSKMVSGFYFIFTVPSEINNADPNTGDFNQYINNVNDKYD